MIKDISFGWKNIRYILIILVASIIIVIKFCALIGKFSQEKYVYRTGSHPNEFYHKKVTPFVLINGMGDTLQLPDNKNHLIIGLNKNVNGNNTFKENLVKTLKVDSFNINLILVTTYKKKDVIDNKYKDVFIYNDNELGELLQLSNFLNFTLLVNESNQIEFFDINIVTSYELKLLVEKFPKKKG